MSISDAALARIVADASTLAERRAMFPETAATDDPQQADELLHRWRELAASGLPEQFDRRLQWDGLDVAAARRALNGRPPADPHALPIWAYTLRALIESVHAASIRPLAQPARSSADRLPFAEVLGPLVDAAREKLRARLESGATHPPAPLTEQAIAHLEHALLSRLAALCARPLQVEFTRLRPAGQTFLSRLRSSDARVQYQAFVGHMLTDGLAGFFSTYPALAKLVALCVDDWADASAELVRRLRADSALLAIATDPVIAIQPGLSDPHLGGRTVTLLAFESGRRLVYKPKPLALDSAFLRLLAWCNQQGAPFDLRVPWVAQRDDYGWMEYVAQQPCPDAAAARRYYQRAGALLGLLYLLGATDCHHENLIASGEYPVLVDMETLLQPEARLMDATLTATPADTALYQQFFDSVLRTGLLPRWETHPDSRIAYDVSGLGGAAAQAVRWRVAGWQAVNTDAMRRAYVEEDKPLQANVPTLNGQPLEPADYLPDLVGGFRQMYAFLLARRADLLAADGPLTALAGVRARFLFRETQVYSLVLRQSLAPAALRSGAARSIELERLSRAFVLVPQQPANWPLLAAEQHALERGDIPYFTAFTDSMALPLPDGGRLGHFFPASGYTQLLARLQRMDEANAAQQEALIRGSFAACLVRADARASADADQTPRPAFATSEHLTPHDLLDEARRIGQELGARAFRTADGSLTWLGLRYLSGSGRYQFQPLGDSLYDGRCGMALFLAALERVSGGGFAALAAGALQPVQQMLAQTTTSLYAQRVARMLGIGGADGLGSIIYALVSIADLLDLPEVLAAAQQAAELITPERIAADQMLDITGGSAGAIPGLLKLAARTGSATARERAIACGEHLLTQRVPAGDGTHVWRTLGQTPLTGFSHGAAGIAYALLRLYAATGNPRYRQAAQEGFAYEQSVFMPTAANWPDFRYPSVGGQPVCSTSWCHGAPGIGLARLGALALDNTLVDTGALEAALQTTRAEGAGGVDHLCCGTCGRIETLLLAARWLHRPDLAATGHAWAAALVTRARAAGAYRLFDGLAQPVYHPGLFQGTAGIGYTLLRLGAPDTLPALLLWE